MRDCITCGITKPLDEFGVNKRYADAKHRSCKACERARRRAFYHRNKELEAQRGRHYREQYPERRRATVRKHRYGITQEDYEIWETMQNGRCAVCGDKPLTGLHVDHCHNTKIIRGLLCGNCNRALGMLSEDPERITALAEYATQRCKGGDANGNRKL